MANGKVLLISLLCIAALISCKNPEQEKVNAVTEAMQGTWFSTRNAGDGRIEEEVVLEPNQRFKETTRNFNAEGTLLESHNFSGEWYFDGTNFKRKVIFLDGKRLPPSEYGYVTLELKNKEASRFVGKDNIANYSVEYIKK